MSLSPSSWIKSSLTLRILFLYVLFLLIIFAIGLAPVTVPRMWSALSRLLWNEQTIQMQSVWLEASLSVFTVSKTDCKLAPKSIQEFFRVSGKSATWARRELDIIPEGFFKTTLS